MISDSKIDLARLPYSFAGSLVYSEKGKDCFEARNFESINKVPRDVIIPVGATDNTLVEDQCTTI